MSQVLEHAQAMVKAALAAGADAADALLVQSAETHASIRLGQPEEIERAESSGIGLRVWVGKQVASVSGTDTSPETLKRLAEQAVNIARVAPEDPYATLAPEGLLAVQPNAAALDLVDQNPPDLAWLQAQCKIAEKAARALPGITNSRGGSGSMGSAEVGIATSHGFAHSYRTSSCNLSVSVLAGEGTAMERDYAMSNARHRAELRDAADIGREAAERTLRRMDARPAKSGLVPVIYEPRVAKGLVSSLVSALSGTAVANGTSFLRDSMGKQILRAGVRVIDDPTLVRGLGSRPFDGEGVAAKRLVLIEDGVLQSWLLDVRTALRLGLTTTGHAIRGLSGPPAPAPSNLYLEAGSDSPEALIAEVKDGFYVTETSGHGVNLITGDYSQGASGIWIENGKLTYAVSGVTIAGKLTDMFANFTPANDLKFESRVNAPTVGVGRLTVAGSAADKMQETSAA